MTTYLALDIGTTGAKAALITSEGDVLRNAGGEYPTHTGDSGVVEQNPADWWRVVVEAIQALNPTEADAIAITGQMQNMILLDANGDAVRPAILYSDTRARTQADTVNQRAGESALRQLTGNAQGADSLLAKLLWLYENEPAHLGTAAHLVTGAADVIALKLTGAAAVDTTTASTTGLLALDERQYVNPAQMNVPELAPYFDMLSPPTPGGSQVGTLTDAAAQALGLRPGLPVHHGPGDAGAATLGTGSGEIGTAYAYLGTSGWVAFTAAEKAAPDSGVITIAHPRPANTIQVAPLLTAGGNLTWIRDVFAADYDPLVAAALERPPTNLIYLPYLNGERAPFVDPLARGALIGLDARTTQGDMVRAVLEGVAYAYRHALTALTATFPARITLIGGGARSDVWSQLFADVLGLDVFVPANPETVGLYGAVLAAEVERGSRADYAVSFTQGAMFTPDAARHTHYTRHYETFRAAYPALKTLFHQLAAD